MHMCTLIDEHTKRAAPLSSDEMLARVSEHFASIESFKFLIMSMHLALQLLFTSVSKVVLSCVLKHDCADWKRHFLYACHGSEGWPTC